MSRLVDVLIVLLRDFERSSVDRLEHPRQIGILKFVEHGGEVTRLARARHPEHAETQISLVEEVLQGKLLAAESANCFLSGNASALAKVSAAYREALLHLVEERQEDLVTAIWIERAVESHVAEREFSQAMGAGCFVGVKQ